jgi:hemolysin D
VTPVQALAVVVPSQAPLEIEAIVSNRNIGLVHTGQRVEIKVNPFNFTCYGYASWQSDKLVVGCHHPRQTTCPLQRSNREPGQSQRDARTELGYAARISLDRTNKRVYEKRVKLSPRMAVTVEIKTGSRRISYLLSPLAKYRLDSLRER